MSYVRKKCALENARQKMRDKNFVAHFWARIFQRAFFTHIIHTRALRSLYFAEEMSSKSQKTAKLERKRYLPILRFSARPGARERAFWRNPDHIVILCSKNALVEKLKNWHLWASNPPPWPGRGTLDPGPFADSYRHCKSKLISFGKVNYTWLWMHALIGMWSEGRKSVPTVMASRQCMRQCSDHCWPATSVA